MSDRVQVVCPGILSAAENAYLEVPLTGNLLTSLGTGVLCTSYGIRIALSHIIYVKDGF